MKITARSLFETAGIPVPYVLLIEGYKEATVEFSAVSPDAPAKIAQYKDLVQRNQATGDERNIDYWRKQGWDAFVAFVDKKSSAPTKTQLKRKKVVGQSITLREDDEWLIVIPLDKDASCFHGKNSDWCTTKYNKPYFEEYFYDKGVVLIYCLNKTSGGMWALAGHKRATGELEIFDQRDKSITAEELHRQTGLIASQIVELALAQSEPINKSRSDYEGVRSRISAKLNALPDGVRDEEMEHEIIRHSFLRLAISYAQGGREASEPLQMLVVRGDVDRLEFIKNPSEKVQKMAVQEKGNTLRYIKNPSEEVQKLALQNTAWAIQYIKNPSEEMQRLVVQKNGDALQFIKNPSEEVQKLAVRNYGYAMRHIENPSEEVQKLAVQESGDAIRYIKNPSEEIQRIAVLERIEALRYIKNPSEEIQRIAAKKNGLALKFIKNPSEEIQKLAVQRDAFALHFIEEPSEEVQKLAVQASGHAMVHIANPTPAVRALHRKLWPDYDD